MDTRTMAHDDHLTLLQLIQPASSYTIALRPSGITPPRHIYNLDVLLSSRSFLGVSEINECILRHPRLAERMRLADYPPAA